MYRAEHGTNVAAALTACALALGGMPASAGEGAKGEGAIEEARPERVSIGFRGDGTGVFPADCSPVLSWSETKNIVWKTPLPNVGTSSPVCVGDRVFLTCEPGWRHDAPLLVCVGAVTGKVLWQREIDHFDLLAEPDRARAKALRKTFFENRRRMFEEGFEAKEKLGFGLSGPAKVRKWPEFKELRKRYAFHSPIWAHCCIGMSFPTPVSDGRHVYVVTAYKVAACYDLAGRLRWMRWHRDEEYTYYRGGKHRGAMHYNASYVMSPFVVGDKLIVNANTFLRAYETKTGRTVWEVALEQWNYMIGSPILLKLPPFKDGEGDKRGKDGKAGRDEARDDSAGPPEPLEPVKAVFTSSGELIRVSDGKVLAEKIGQMAGAVGPVTDGKDVVFFSVSTSGGHHQEAEDRKFTEKGFYAVRLKLTSPDKAEPELLWRASIKNEEATSVYFNNLLFVGRYPKAVDPATGRLLGEANRHYSKGCGSTHALSVAAGNIYTLGQEGDGAAFTATRTPKRIGLSKLDEMPGMEGETRDKVIRQSGSDEPEKWYGWHFARTLPFFTGNRIFIRTYDYLYCIGDADEEFRSSKAFARRDTGEPDSRAQRSSPSSAFSAFSAVKK